METRSVSEFNKWLKVAFDFINTKLNFIIKGEISSLNIHQSGHVYATLKENNETVKLIIWKSLYQKKNISLKIGQNIEIKGKINYYEPTSSISLIVNDFRFIDEMGSLKQKMKLLEQKFIDQGFFDVNKKKSLPKKIENVAIVTARTGDAINDIVKTFSRRNKTINLVLYPCLVQGNNAKYEIAKQINKINSQTKYNFDAIIVGRGGGSLEDLFAFNEEEVIEAIYNSQIFIISAVGHEADVMLSDKVADMRASTPTAAAEMLSSKTLQDYKNEITYLSNYINLSYSNKIEKYHNIIQSLENSQLIVNKILILKQKINFENINLQQILNLKQQQLNSTNCEQLLNNSFLILKNKINFDFDENFVLSKINQAQQYLNNLQINNSINNQIILKQQKLQNLEENITNLGPRSILNRGYSLIKDDNGNVIKTLSEVPQTFEVQLSDGCFKARKV